LRHFVLGMADIIGPLTGYGDTPMEMKPEKKKIFEIHGIFSYNSKLIAKLNTRIQGIHNG